MLDAYPITRLDAHNRPDHRRCYSIRATRWACVYTQPQAERWADSNLRRLGYVTYLPLHAVQRRDRSLPTLRHTVEAPLFARYLFIQFDHLAESWSPLRAAPGVVDLIRHGASVHYAQEADISALQATEAARRTITPPDTIWRPGAACKLADGALYGLPAVVTAVHDTTATIAIMMLGHLRSVSVPLDCLRARDDG